MRKILTALRPWYPGILFLAALVAFIVRPAMPDWIRESLLVITAITGAHLIERGLLWNRITAMVAAAFSQEVKPELLAMQEKWTADLAEQIRLAGITQTTTVQELVRQTNDLLRSASRCGLAGVYADRHSAQQDIEKAIAKAEKRAFVLGIAFKREVSINYILDTLRPKMADPEFQVKILLLDPIRSPSVFRTFLESPVEEVGRIVGGADPEVPADVESLFLRQLYLDSLAAFAHLQEERNHIFQDRQAVKFYAHNPNCWLAIIDDTAYFEPYTFGSQRHGEGLWLGPHMPVLRFEAVQNGKPFEILEDHFDKVWTTTEIDLFHFEARNRDRDRIAKDIFRKRLPWLKRVYWALDARRQCVTEKRKWSREPCDSEPPPTITLQWEDADGKPHASEKAMIVDSSRGSISVRLQAAAPVPTLEQQVVLAQQASGTQTAYASFTAFMMKRFVGQSFRVKRIIQSAPVVVGLERFTPAAGPSSAPASRAMLK